MKILTIVSLFAAIISMALGAVNHNWSAMTGWFLVSLSTLKILLDE